MHVPADTGSFRNHYTLKAVNMVDRVLRASGSSAQERLKAYVKQDIAGANPKKQYLHDRARRATILLFETDTAEDVGVDKKNEGRGTTEMTELEWQVRTQKCAAPQAWRRRGG